MKPAAPSAALAPLFASELPLPLASVVTVSLEPEGLLLPAAALVPLVLATPEAPPLVTPDAPGLPVIAGVPTCPDSALLWALPEAAGSKVPWLPQPMDTNKRQGAHADHVTDIPHSPTR
jgi:hypothetical protein